MLDFAMEACKRHRKKMLLVYLTDHPPHPRVSESKGQAQGGIQQWIFFPASLLQTQTQSKQQFRPQSKEVFNRV